MNKSFLDNKTTTYEEQYCQGGRSYGKTFFENRIRQAYKSGIDVGFIEKHKLIKYLEDKIKEPVSYNLLYDGKQQAYKDILEKVRSGKYE